MAKLAKNPFDEVIELDFGKYWPLCVSKRLNIAAILNAGRWGMSYKSLPEEVQKILRSPEVIKMMLASPPVINIPAAILG